MRLFQAGSEEYVQESRAQTSSNHQETKTKTTSQTQHHEHQKEYRKVELNNIPLPTTGGHVTGKLRFESVIRMWNFSLFD